MHETRNVPVPHTNWYATQNGRAVDVRDRDNERLLTTVQPPHEWGRDWRWHLNDQGIVFTHAR